MGLLDILKSLFSAKTPGGREFRPPPRDLPRGRHDLGELARRLEMDAGVLKALEPVYHAFTVPKRSGGMRRIDAPIPELKSLQRRILRRLLGRLKAHPTVTGFERGHSIVTHAAFHANSEVVVRLDIRNFFGSTTVGRVHEYFRRIGWTDDAALVLTRLTTHQGSLPQGAPTSPRLANLVNYRMDARLESMARVQGARYSRYADDLTFSFDKDEARKPRHTVAGAVVILHEFGYRLQRRKLRIRRRHQQQRVTGLIVNDGPPRLPRKTRRWLRAVAHHLATGRDATLTPAQLEGWKSLQAMVERQSKAMES